MQTYSTLERVYWHLRRRQARLRTKGRAFLIQETWRMMEELSECEKEDHASN